MADELDKFVLKYEVEAKEAASQLEQLNKKVKEVNETQEKGKKGLSDFGKDAADKLGEVIPAVDKVTGAIKMMTSEFAVAAIAVAALAAGIKAAMYVREQYGQQRQVGLQIGVSGIREEEYERQIVKNSNGNVSADKVREENKKFSEKLVAAYTDPSRTNSESNQLKKLGVNPGARTEGMTSFNSAITQLATNFSKMSTEEVQGQARAIGMDPDYAVALRNRGAGIGKITEQSTSDLAGRQNAQENLLKFNDSVAKLSTSFTQLEQILGQRFLPVMTHIVDWLVKMTGGVPEQVSVMSNAAAGTTVNTDRSLKSGLVSMLFGSGVGAWYSGSGKQGAPTTDTPSMMLPGGVKAAPVIEKAADKIADAADTAAESQRNYASEMSLAINMFSSSVSSFANAIDEKQAWAAWAGELGRASGLGNTADQAISTNPAISGKSVAPGGGNSKYDELFNRIGKEEGVSPDLLKKVAFRESSLNPMKVGPLTSSGERASGMMGLMPENQRKFGVKDWSDPEQSIRAGAKLLKMNIDSEHGVLRDGLMAYFGGTDRSKWGPNTLAYPDMVLDGGRKTGIGQTRADLQLKNVQANVAARAGAPLQMVQLGQLTKGDVGFEFGQKTSELQNYEFQLGKGLSNPNLTRSALSKNITESRETVSGFNAMQKNQQQVYDMQKDGGRMITIGEIPVTVNVGVRSDNPAAVVDATAKIIGPSISDAVNQHVQGIKR